MNRRHDKRVDRATNWMVVGFSVATLILIGVFSCAVIDAAIKAAGG